jgi:protein required for attachment to host cells
MYRACIIVVDASRARLFTFERTSDGEGLHEQLSERRDLVSPARRMRASELFSDDQGSSRTGPLHYGLGDGGDGYIEALDAEFARAIVAEAVELIRSSPVQRLILCASPRMLGTLREVGGELRRSGVPIDELPRDLVKLSVAELREHLASHGLLPVLPASPVVHRGA